MRILVLLCCVWLAGAGTIPEKCDRVTFDGKYYDKQVLTTVSRAREFSYVTSTNTLFFSFSLKDKKNNHRSANGYYNINTNKFAEIPEVPGGISTTIDPETEDVFLAGGDGVFKFNQKTKAVERYAAKGMKIVTMYFNKELYYMTKPNYKIYNYKDGIITEVIRMKANILPGDEKEYFYLTVTGISIGQDGKEEDAVKLPDPEDHTHYGAFAEDKNNKGYVVDGDAVYVLNGSEKKFDRVAYIKDIQGLAFDQDNNVIYSDDKQIYKLTPSETTCPPSV